jgi:hypothetical protein
MIGMKRFIFNILVALIFVGCVNNDERKDAYVSQPSLLLSKYNLTHARIHLNSAHSGVLTFSSNGFRYESAEASFSGTWSVQEYVVSINNDETNVISSIDYTTADGYTFTTTFTSGDYELAIGDYFMLNGDQVLSGTVSQIERNDF